MNSFGPVLTSAERGEQLPVDPAIETEGNVSNIRWGTNYGVSELHIRSAQVLSTLRIIIADMLKGLGLEPYKLGLKYRFEVKMAQPV